ncbi:ABC transporter substrate-binding protein [Paenibacillus marchantiophytorum]|uniref:ABC transporter substrate-binding protein n=1 Tax=Paenibacillus marchantiophytorum TaxID=1619310 RepID=A0ABQ1EN86_9BACL|nr:ABC transporter substrate-binding protein [Paenibacillus marchantiophytorum]GFZ78756.1 ABC transporter substrate-binding protein [Paenibacillus marchantiophytorum]
MKKCSSWGLVLLLVICMVLSGCSSSGMRANEVKNNGTQTTKNKGKYKIGYDIYFAGNTWSVQMYKEFQSEVKRNQDKIEDVIYVESEGKVDKQIANIEDLITKGVDVIITTPNSPTALAPVLKKAQGKGIKVVLLAAKSEYETFDSLVTVNDYDFGKAGAQWLVKQLDGKGKIITLNGIAGISVSDERWKGAKEVFDKYPDIKVVASANADWDYAKAKLEVSNMLSANPQIDGVWSQGGGMTLGAIESFQAANRTLVPMTSEDNNGFLKKWQELRSKGFKSIAVAKPTWLGSEALKTALNLLEGKNVEKNQILPVSQITEDNLEKFVRTDLPDSFWANSRMSDQEVKETFSK